MVDSAFLRSINIQLDIGHPDRLGHFRPTSKSVKLVSSVLGGERGNAVFVIAPYGSGKSITAGYLGELIENQTGAAGMLTQVEGRMEEVSASLAEDIRRRREAGKKGLFVPLYGHVPSAPAAIKEGMLAAMRRTKLGRQRRTIDALDANSARDVFHLVSECAKKLKSAGRDHLVIVWDEFGRHLQGLISEGRPEELDVLQVLAEVASRTSEVPVTLVLLLHRSLVGYASGLPSGVRREWAKIEGRFETLQYLDDSSELYQLLGSLVEESRPTDFSAVEGAGAAEQAKGVGLFPDVDAGVLTPALGAAYPLEPTTLYLLPRVAARVAQNERTLFSFLQWTSLEEPVPPSAIYDYFRGDFQSDAGAGGTQRAWLETESAIQKVEAGSIDEEALKCAFLLGLGLSGERSHATYAQLLYSLSSEDEKAGARSLDVLIDRKLLVHRRHSDQVLVWHGTDVDLRGRLDDEKNRNSDDFSLAPFLSRELPPPVWRPVEYNARRGIRRYLESEYATVDGLKTLWDELNLTGWAPGADGRVVYVLPKNEEEWVKARDLAQAIDDPRLFVVVAREVTALRDAALDLWCLLRMHADHALIGTDPMVKVELDHVTDDARTGLQPMVDRVLRPQRLGSDWFHGGKAIDVANVPALRRVLSEVMDVVFPLTPEIDSEMVVRRAPSSVVINARKKVELGLLERYGQEDVGIQGGFADKAIFRCVFLRTGLYAEGEAGWALASPEALAGKGMSEVWSHVRDFFTIPGKDKDFRALLHELMEPPYGVREGVLPLLIAAGFKAFPTAAAVRYRGQFVDDLLPSVIESIARTPEDFVLDVVGVSKREHAYLKGLLSLFAGPGAVASSERDILRACMDALIAWRHSLPPAVANSRFLSKEARVFERELAAPDPVRLFLEELPRLVGATTNQPKKLLAGVARLKAELDDIEIIFRNEAVQALGQALLARGIRNGDGVRDQAARWASYFPGSLSGHLPDHVTRGVLSRLRSPYDDDGLLVNALSKLLVGLPIRQWDDSSVPGFGRQLRYAFEVIEGTAIGLGDDDQVDPELSAGLVALAEARTKTIAMRLSGILGAEQAATRLEQIAAELRSELSTKAQIKS